MVIIAPLNSNHFMVRVMATVLNDTVVITLAIKAIKNIINKISLIFFK